MFRDLWYFLYSSTDKEFRERHLREVLRDYYDSFSTYLALEEVQVSFEEFRQEMNSTRIAAGLGTAMVFPLFISLCPDTIEGQLEKKLIVKVMTILNTHMYFNSI